MTSKSNTGLRFKIRVNGHNVNGRYNAGLQSVRFMHAGKWIVKPAKSLPNARDIARKYTEANNV